MQVVYAKDTCSLATTGAGQVLIHRGSHWPADDPLVKQFPHVFSDDPRYGLSYSGDAPDYMSEPPVEQATAAPGEKRTVRRG